MRLTFLLVILLSAGLILFPAETADAARNGLMLCVNVVLPSLFPFFVLSSFVTLSGISRALSRLFAPLMSRLFRISGAGASALILGMLGGYPIGASCIKTLYQQGECSKEECEHLLGFCNNSGPSFLLGAVGVGVFGSIKLGLLLLTVHWLSAMTVGLFFRFHSLPLRHSRLQSGAPISFSSAFCQAVGSGLQSALNVCAFIVFFAVLTEILHLFSFLPSAGLAGAISTGLFEITSGIAALQTSAANLPTAFVLAAGLIGFGGLSIHAQTLSVLSETNLSVKKYFLGKLLHALISAGYAALLATWCFRTQAVFAPSASNTNLPGLAVTAIALLSFWILFLFSEKRTGNS